MILISGATGLTGSELVRNLSAKGIAFRAMVRNPEKAEWMRKLDGVDVVTADMADALYELFAERRKGKESKVWPEIREVFGLKPTSFLEFAQRNAAIFRGEEAPPKI